MDCFVVPPRNDGTWSMRSLKNLICSETVLYCVEESSKDYTWIDKFDLNLTRMDVDVDKITGNIDCNDSQRIFTMMNLPTISIHYGFLKSSILNRTAIDIEFTIFIRSKSECTIADYTIDDQITMLIVDSMKLLSSFFPENLYYSILDIIRRRKVVDDFSVF